MRLDLQVADDRQPLGYNILEQHPILHGEDPTVLTFQRSNSARYQDGKMPGNDSIMTTGDRSPDST